MIKFRERCIPVNCSYCKFVTYVGIPGKPDNYMTGLYTCIHPDSPMFGKEVLAERSLCKYSVPTVPHLVGVFIYSSPSNQGRPSKVETVLRVGNWVTRLLSVNMSGNVKHHEVYHVGIFKTAQEAYLQAGLFIDERKILFRSDMPGKGKLPTHLVIELQGFGRYSDNVQKYYALPYLHGRKIPYMDAANIMRPDHLITQRKLLSHLIKIDQFGRWDYKKESVSDE